MKTVLAVGLVFLLVGCYAPPKEGQSTIDYKLSQVNGCFQFQRPEVKLLTNKFLNQRITEGEYIAGVQHYHQSYVKGAVCVANMFENSV